MTCHGSWTSFLTLTRAFPFAAPEPCLQLQVSARSAPSICLACSIAKNCSCYIRNWYTSNSALPRKRTMVVYTAQKYSREKKKKKEKSASIRPHSCRVHIRSTSFAKRPTLHTRTKEHPLPLCASPDASPHLPSFLFCKSRARIGGRPQREGNAAKYESSIRGCELPAVLCVVKMKEDRKQAIVGVMSYTRPKDS